MAKIPYMGLEMINTLIDIILSCICKDLFLNRPEFMSSDAVLLESIGTLQSNC